MKGLRIFSNPRRRDRIVLVVISVAFLSIATLASGCGSTKKSASTASNSGTGRPGTGIAFVKVLPNRLMLRQGETTTIQIKRNLGFVVGVQNDGDQTEQNVKVTLVIHQMAPASPITKTLTIPKIYSGTTTNVDFAGPYAISVMVRVVPITVDVHPVPNEMNTANNFATYKVRFSF